MGNETITKNDIGFRPGELKILWLLKDMGGEITSENCCDMIAAEVRMLPSTVRAYLTSMERKSLVISHYRWPEKSTKGRYNSTVKVELVDPDMELPFRPHWAGQRAVSYVEKRIAVPKAQKFDGLGTPVVEAPIIEREESDFERIFIQMVDRVNEQHEEIVKLQFQCDKLHEMVNQLNADNENLRRQRREQPRHYDRLAQKLGQLNPEEWEKLQRQAPQSRKE